MFGALEALVARAGPALSSRISVDGEVSDDPALFRALLSQINRFNELRRTGRPAVALVEEASADVAIVLDVRTADDRVSIAAHLVGGDRSLSIARGPSRPLPGRTSLLPPLIAIAIALAFRRALLALFVGIYAGAFALAVDRDGWLWAPASGLWDVFAVYLRTELLDTLRFEMIGFVVALIAMVGVMSRAGGVQGMVERLLGLARSARSALFLTWGMGVLIFFDDYANCMLVGATMRPLTDRLRISREKLAYVVDSTAAPIAGISLLSTWIAFEVSVFSAQLPSAGISESGYAVFMHAMPYRFYCFTTLLFVVVTIASRRDFGPMERAERRARTTGQLVAPDGRPAISDRLAAMRPAPQMTKDWSYAAAPIAATIVVTMARIFLDGGGAELQAGELLTLQAVTGVLMEGGGPTPIFVGSCAGLALSAFIAGSNPTRIAIAAGTAGVLAFQDTASAVLAPLLGDSVAGYAAATAVFAVLGLVAGGASSALLGSTRRPHLALGELRSAAASGSGALGFAVVLLFEAWMIGRVCADLGTADYLVALLSGSLPPTLLPLLLFAAACAVSFATGSSWSTMSILLPNVVALASVLGADTELGSFGLVVISIAAVLDGSIFGDHCSPISDTTVLSSVASGSDHVDHVRTQAPYAFSAAVLAATCGYLPSVWIPWWSFPLSMGTALLATVLLVGGLGRRVPEAVLDEPA